MVVPAAAFRFAGPDGDEEQAGQNQSAGLFERSGRRGVLMHVLGDELRCDEPV